jgi:hypothetical protein
MSTSTDNAFCKTCGMPGIGVHYADCPEVTKNPGLRWLTEEDVRRIVREELDRRAGTRPGNP